MYKLKTEWWVKATTAAATAAGAAPMPASRQGAAGSSIPPAGQGGGEDEDEDEGKGDDVGALLAPRDRARLHAFAEEFERRLSKAASDWSYGVAGVAGGAQGKCGGQCAAKDRSSRRRGKRAAKAQARARAKGQRRATALLTAQHQDGAGPDAITRIRSELASLLRCSNIKKRDDRLERVCRPLLGGVRW